MITKPEKAYRDEIIETIVGEWGKGGKIRSMTNNHKLSDTSFNCFWEPIGVYSIEMYRVRDKVSAQRYRDLKEMITDYSKRLLVIEAGENTDTEKSLEDFRYDLKSLHDQIAWIEATPTVREFHVRVIDPIFVENTKRLRELKDLKDSPKIPGSQVAF